MNVELATKDDVANYMGVLVVDLPSNVEILIKRASELVMIKTRSNYDESNLLHVDAVMLAVCAQCQDWIEREVNGVSGNDISSYSLGELSVTYSDVDRFSNKLCAAATKYLNHVHLLYKGMR